MKKIILYAILAYLIGSFVCASFDISEWNAFVRGFIGVCYTVAVITYFEEKE